MKADCIQLEARGAIGPLDVAMFRRRTMRLEAELRRHDEFDRVLPTLPEPSSRPAGEGPDAASAPEVGGPSPPAGREDKATRRDLDREGPSGPDRGAGKREKP